MFSWVSGLFGGGGGSSPLQQAVESGDIAAVQRALEPNHVSVADLNNAFGVAIEHKYWDIAELMLQYGADVNERCYLNVLGPHDLDTAQFLLDHGARNTGCDVVAAALSFNNVPLLHVLKANGYKDTWKVADSDWLREITPATWMEYFQYAPTLPKWVIDEIVYLSLVAENPAFVPVIEYLVRRYGAKRIRSTVLRWMREHEAFPDTTQMRYLMGNEF